MLSNKNRWGFLFCAAAAVLLGTLYFIFYSVPPDRNPIFYQKVLPSIGLAASFLSLFFGHFSYPRIHSIKVYFIGYSAGLAGIAFFILGTPFFSIPPAPPGFGEFIVFVSLVNFTALTLMPSGTKYRTIKSVTLCVAAADAALYCIFRFGPGAALWLKPFTGSLFWTGPVLLAATLALAFLKVKNEFFLGGITAGCAVLLLGAWVSSRIDPANAGPLLLLMFTGTSVYCFVCLVIHGFFRMEHRITYDPLLKIFNRDYCSRIITEQANINVAPPFGVAMIDIDHFKQVNDTYGHQAGDAVLHAVSQTVHRGAGPDGIVCRYGGEELAVFFPQRSANEVSETMETIRKEIEKAKTLFGKKSISVTISVGVSHREEYTQSIMEVIQAADKALYAVKNEGRNRVKCQKTPLINKR
ncbi:MAG: GGDEF domain-containing protein [Chitinispirillaceae bacterium]|nr:GGDEF domain-containing protein [Chitinispirillaceae bacterium]